MRPMRTQRRAGQRNQRLVDPAPLPSDAPQFVDDKARKFYAAEKRKAMGNMREFDRQPAVVRAVENAVGNVQIAQQLVAHGIRSAEEAEPVVRAMLEGRARKA